VRHQQPSQEQYSFQILESLIWQVLITIQVLQRWTQMLLYGKELQSTMVKSTERKNINRMPTTSKPTVKLKKLLLILESHMLQLFSNFRHQQPMLRMTRVFHTLMQKETIIQEPQPWIQMPRFGKELPSMTERCTEKSNIRKMPTTSRPTEQNRRM